MIEAYFITMRTVLFYLVFVCLFFVSLSKENDTDKYDPDMYKNVTQLITSKGYPAENYVVQTKDGYLLQVQRIPHGRNGRRHDPSKKPVLILHGLLLAATDWVINFPEQALGFILADAGYDVWLGNSRGNTYSRRNVNYSDDTVEFWNFSFNEVGKYDIPVMIDLVLKKTGFKKLFYIGHSQGTTAAFALLSESQEYNEKIQLYLALSPVATLGFTFSALGLLAPFAGGVQFLDTVFGNKEFLPNDALIKFLSAHVCANEYVDLACANILFLINGFDLKELNTTRLGVYTSHIPAGTSTKSIVHYAQLVGSTRFTKFDYGISNILHYNQFTPPEYDLSKITAPVALLTSMNDALADPIDVSILVPKLKSLVEHYVVPLPVFAHYDFCIGLNANTLVYNEILRLLKEYH